MDVMLGDAANGVSSVYGTAFDLSYDKSLIEADQVNLVYSASFLNNGNQNIEFGKMDFSNGMMYGATVRVDHANVNGFGKIAELRMKIRSDVSPNSVLKVDVSNPAM